MEQARIIDNKPVEIQVTEGETYYWCSCGRSENQPFCDGAHAGSRFEPVAFTAHESGTVNVCQCKLTNNSPYCDGMHSSLPE